MKRTSLLAAVMVLLGLAAYGCGGGGSSASGTTSTPTTASASVATPLAWITSEARPWNDRLNQAQAAIIADSMPSSEESAGTFFGHLGVACTKMLDDAEKAQSLPAAPSEQLDQAWKAMAADTQVYAQDCLTLVRTQTKSDLTTWQNSLQAMNTAGASLNTVVNSIRTGTGA